MLKWLARRILYFYAPQESSISACEFVVPMGYALRGTREHPEFPEISHNAVLRAAEIAGRFCACVVWANTGYLGQVWQEKENTLKLNLAKKYFSLRGILCEILVASEGILNTVVHIQSFPVCLVSVEYGVSFCSTTPFGWSRSQYAPSCTFSGIEG